MSTRYRTVVAGCATYALCVSSALVADVPGVKPGDDAMTCEEIATELSPYAQQMMPNLQALGSTQQQMYTQAQKKLQERQLENEALTPLATAGALDPTGASKQAYQLALMAQMAKEKAENEAAANSPLAKQGRAQADQVVAQGQQMQSNARIQRLIQLAQQKRCGRK